MSDYIDELVAKHFPCAGTGCRKDSHDEYCPASQRRKGTDLARAVAERVRERAWILVSERLPEDGDLVLSLDKHGHVRVELGANSNDFTHWQPLPPPPGRGVSDYIDELVREHLYLPNARLTGEVANIGLAELARAVAERVRASAWVCSWCHGSGLHPGPYDDVPTCDRCAGRGVTFGGEA